MTEKEKGSLKRLTVSAVVFAFAPLLLVPFFGWSSLWWIGFAGVGMMAGSILFFVIVSAWSDWIVGK